jgi:hypothetical protein
MSPVFVVDTANPAIPTIGSIVEPAWPWELGMANPADPMLPSPVRFEPPQDVLVVVVVFLVPDESSVFVVDTDNQSLPSSSDLDALPSTSSTTLTSVPLA